MESDAEKKPSLAGGFLEGDPETVHSPIPYLSHQQVRPNTTCVFLGIFKISWK